MKWVKRAIIAVLLIVTSPLLFVAAVVFAVQAAVDGFGKWLFSDVR